MTRAKRRCTCPTIFRSTASLCMYLYLHLHLHKDTRAQAAESRLLMRASFAGLIALESGAINASRKRAMPTPVILASCHSSSSAFLILLHPLIAVLPEVSPPAPMSAPPLCFPIWTRHVVQRSELLHGIQYVSHRLLLCPVAITQLLGICFARPAEYTSRLSNLFWMYFCLPCLIVFERCLERNRNVCVRRFKLPRLG
jgi:hypothetical protein